MKKRALLVAIRDYGKPALEVEAAVDEMARWSDLLVSPRYGFTDVQLLADGDATRKNVLKHLAKLLSGTAANDQVVFGFFGHGLLTVNRENGKLQSTLLVSPGAAGDLSEAMITNLDFCNTVERAGPVPETDFTVILDTCFSGNFDRGQGLRGIKPLRVTGVDADADRILIAAVSNPLDPEPSSTRLQLIEGFGSWPRKVDRSFERPLVLAASEPDQLAHQITVQGLPRLVFSMRAQEELWSRSRPPTHRMLIDSINPLHPAVHQNSTIAGDPARENEQFPGQGMVESNPADNATDTVIFIQSAESSLNVRVDGICCWVKGRASDTFLRRLTLPYDVASQDRHIAFLEIADEDIDRVDGGPEKAKYYHVECMPKLAVCTPQIGTVLYRRWELSGHRINITSTAATPPLSLSPAFLRHVPQMKKVLPDLRLTPDEECLKADPPPNRVAGLLDLTVGTVDIGTLEEFFTSFDPPKDWPHKNREPEFTVLRLPISSASVKISLTAFATSSGANSEIFLKPGTAWIRIGNEQLLDITGPGSGESSAEFFKLYYTLSDPDTYSKLPLPLPIPIKSLAPLNACTNSTWP